MSRDFEKHSNHMVASLTTTIELLLWDVDKFSSYYKIPHHDYRNDQGKNNKFHIIYSLEKAF